MAKGGSAAIARSRATDLLKGKVAEHQVAASFTARSGFSGSTLRARPNFDEWHPKHDLIITDNGRPVGGVQLKDGQASYVKMELPKYPDTPVVVNTEAATALGPDCGTGAGPVRTTICRGSVESAPFSEADTRVEAATMLAEELDGPAWRSQFSSLVSAAKAGGRDGLVAVGLNLAIGYVEAKIAGSAWSFEEAVGSAMKAGAKVMIRSGLVTWAHIQKFLRYAKQAFSDRLIHTVCSSTVVATAVAEVVVETGADLIAVFRGTMDWDTLLRRLGVATTRAVGGALGAVAALALTKDAPPWVALVALIVLVWIGARLGKSVGEKLFEGEGLVPAPA
jgi:hypothetical protein